MEPVAPTRCWNGDVLVEMKLISLLNEVSSSMNSVCAADGRIVALPSPAGPWI